MMLAQPAECAAYPEVVEALASCWIGAAVEGAVGGEEAAATQDAGNAPYCGILVGHEVDGVEEEDGVGLADGTAQVGGIALDEGDRAAGQALLGDIYGIGGRLDAHHGGGAPAMFEGIQHQLGDIA